MKTKKRSSPKIELFFFPKSGENQKKVFAAIWDYIRPEFEGFIRAGSFSSDHPALKSRWGGR